MSRFSVVLSGFERYENIGQNPSRLVMEALENRGISGLPEDISADLTTVLLPLSFEKAWSVLKETIDRAEPQIVIATGFKRNAGSISLERCALNRVEMPQSGVKTSDRRMPEGRMPEGRTSNGIVADINPSENTAPIIESAPAAYWTGIPLHEILNSFAQNNIPATLSSDAGIYICNSLFFRLLDAASKNKNMTAGFVSLPQVVQDRSDRGGLPKECIISAIENVIATSADFYRRQDSAEGILRAE